MEQFSSVLLNGRLRFGKYPTDAEVAQLKANGYSIFVDLCPSKQITWQPYDKTNIYYNHWPIKDRTAQIEDPERFTAFLDKLVTVMRAGYKVYVHCLGGHGRSAMVAAVIYGKFTGVDAQTALQAVYDAHQQRTEIKPKFRKMGAPQNAEQKNYVLQTLGENAIYFYGQENFLSNFYKAPFIVNGVTYPTSEHYFQAQKFIYPGANSRSLEYAQLVATQSTPNKAKIIANQRIQGGYKWRLQLNDIIKAYPDVQMRADWEQVKDNVMRAALYYKFTQNPSLMLALKATGGKRLVEHTKRDAYWGDAGDGSGKNRLGELLMELRAQLN